MCQSRGLPFPADWLNEPELPDEWREWLDAFYVLSPSRQAGFSSVGFIPLAEMEAFARIFTIADPQAFVLVMRHLDGLYVEYKNAKLESNSKG